jgi:hypothetical protein
MPPWSQHVEALQGASLPFGALHILLKGLSAELATASFAGISLINPIAARPDGKFDFGQ